MEFLIYLTKVNIAIALLYFLYRFAFQNDTMFVVKRAILLFSLVFVLVYPLIDVFTVWFTSLNRNEVLHIFDFTTFMLAIQPEVVVYGVATETTSRLSFIEMAIIAITALYLIGVAFCVMKFIVQIISISRIIFSARKTNIHGVDVLVSNYAVSPFSFFGKIIISEKTFVDAELNEILLHEQTHVRQWHSVDVILSELLCAFAWFNPAAWRLKREIRLNLEYLADDAVISDGCNIERYQLSLVQLSYQKNGLTVTNNFNFSPLKKRIIMMQKTKTPKIGLVKYLLIFPVAFVLMFLNIAATPAYLEVEEVAVVETVEVVQNEDPIFEFVEEIPRFLGGDLNQWLGQNIRFPYEALSQGIQGTVVVQYVIEKDGSLSDVRIARSVDPYLDAEALRVVSLMPNWQPGKDGGEAVRFRFTLPIRFQLTR